MTTAKGKASEADEKSAWASRKTWWIFFGIVLAVSAGAVFAAFNPAPHTGGDNAGYVTLAYSLVRDGRYTELFDPAGLPHTKYPPVFPALLALLIGLGARTWVALKSIAALSTVGAAVLTYVWVERRSGPVWALGAALVLCLSSAVVYYSHWILSDPTFVFFTLLSLWALERSDEDGAPIGWLALGVAAAGLAYFTRSAGLPLLVALLGWLGIRRRFRALAASVAALGVPALLWLLRARGVGPARGAYGSEFWLVDPYQPTLGRVGVGGLVERVMGNLTSYVGTHVPAGIVGNQGSLGGAALAFLGVAVVGLGVAGWILVVRRRPGPTELFAPLYVGLILLWPEVWSGDRFALPLFPILLGYGAWAAKTGLRRVAGPAPAVGGAFLAAAFILPAAGSWIGSVQEASACGAVVRARGPFACYGSRIEAFVAAAAWAGAELPEGSSVLTRKPRMFYALSGVPSRTFPFDDDPASHVGTAAAVGARYELLDQWDGLAGRYVVGAVRRNPGAYCALAGFGEDGGTRMLGILPSGGREEGDPGTGGTVRIAPCPADYVVSGDAVAPYTPSSSSRYRIPLLDGLDR